MFQRTTTPADIAVAVNCVAHDRRSLCKLVIAVLAAITFAACSSADVDEPVAISASTERTTAPAPDTTTPAATPSSTAQVPTTARPAPPSPTSPVATPVESSMTTVTTMTPVTTVTPPPASEGIRFLEPMFEVDVQRDVLYGTAPMPDGSGGMVDLLLDVYTPAGDTEPNRPAFIFSHGGGFSAGNKEGGADWATRMAELGYVAASIDYRLGPLTEIAAPLDEQEQAQIDRARNDLQAAVRWFKANATGLGIDPNRIGLGGHSAGAMMSAGATVRWSDPATGSNPEFSAAVCGAVSIAGALNPAYVDPGDAGVIFHHGTLDQTVPYAAAVAARDALLNSGLPVEWHEYEGEDHNLSDASQATIETTSIQWLYEHVATAPYPCSPAVAAGVRVR
jgi:acetyl esterase/lipase